MESEDSYSRLATSLSKWAKVLTFFVDSACEIELDGQNLRFSDPNTDSLAEMTPRKFLLPTYLADRFAALRRFSSHQFRRHDRPKRHIRSQGQLQHIAIEVEGQCSRKRGLVVIPLHYIGVLIGPRAAGGHHALFAIAKLRAALEPGAGATGHVVLAEVIPQR